MQAHLLRIHGVRSVEPYMYVREGVPAIDANDMSQQDNALGSTMQGRYQESRHALASHLR